MTEIIHKFYQAHFWFLVWGLEWGYQTLWSRKHRGVQKRAMLCNIFMSRE